MNRILKWLYQPYKWLVVIPFMMIITLVLGLICVVVGAFFSQDATNTLAVMWSRLACGIVPVKVRLTGKKITRRDGLMWWWPITSPWWTFR